MGFSVTMKDAAKKIALGTEVNDADQSGLLKLCKTLGVDVTGMGGICFELCRRYVTAVVGGTFEPSETLLSLFYGPEPDFSGPDVEYLQDLILTHNARKSNVDGNYDVTGLARTGLAVRGTSCWHFTVLRDRKDVINYMYKNEGVYIYVFTATGGGGHAVAFSVQTDRLVFFDPNCGEVIVPKSNTDVRTKFLDWWKQYWKTNYKDDYTKGGRKLVRYSRSD